MKVASVIWKESNTLQISKTQALVDYYEFAVKQAYGDGIELIVFPALAGCFYQQLNKPGIDLECPEVLSHSQEFIEMTASLSLKYKIAICPGSYWKKEDNRIFQTSCILLNGNTVLEQKQLYLSRWEQQMGFSRGVKTGICEISGWKVGLILSTDVFYPQVSRSLAMNGTDIVLSPVSFTGKKLDALQLSGMWEETQLNGFYSVESGFNGRIGNMDFWGSSFINAPLEMTKEKDGFLAAGKVDDTYIAAELDNVQRKQAVSKFDALSMINLNFCRNMNFVGGAKSDD